MRQRGLIILLLILSVWLQGATAEDYNYTETVKKIYDAVKDKNSEFHHASWKTLAELTDTYGPRLWGSPSLELFLMDLQERTLANNISSRLEPVKNIPRWQRLHEELVLLSPRPFPQKLGVIGLGGTKQCIGTVGEVVVVKNKDELDALNNSQVEGKIILFNNPWVNYGVSGEYRRTGAQLAKDRNATAVLVRSVAPFSIYSPHTGIHDNGNGTLVCAAAITIEDADMFQRMQDRGQKIVVNLTLMNNITWNVSSNNFIAEIKGSNETKNHQIVLFGGHVDSWDTGSQTGANDDGGGIITCWEALRLLKKLQLIPKRTLRVIGWSGEEWGDKYYKNGADQYYEDHKDEIKHHILAFESDEGSTKPFGFGVNGTSEAIDILQQIAETNLGIINCTKIFAGEGESADVEILHKAGIPIMNNQIADPDDPTDPQVPNDHKFYFKYHHSAGDSMTMMNPDDMDDNVIAIAAMMYIVANLDQDLPNDYKDSIFSVGEVGK